MRVIVCTNMYPTRMRPSSGVFVKEQVEDLRRLGVKIDVLAFDASDDRRRYLRAALRLRRLVAAVDADLIHAHYGLTGAVALAQRSLPVVTTFHGSDVNGYVPWQKAVSRVVARLTTPIFVAPQLASALGMSHSTVVPAAVDTEVFRPSDRLEARRALGWPRGAKLALFPGSRGNRRKRPDLFDAALARARQLVPGLEGVTLEELSRAEVARVMNAVDVTVLTSDYEGSPVAVRESLACNTPVVSVDVGDVTTVLDGLPGCAVTARDPSRLARAIATAIRSDRSPMMRERALESSRPRVAAQVLRVYESMIEDADSRGRT